MTEASSDTRKGHLGGTLGKSTKRDEIPAITETQGSVLNYPNQLVIDFEKASDSYISWR